MSKKIRTVEISLSEPAAHEGVTYDKLTLRRMKAGDTLVAEGEPNKAKAGFLLYAAMAGVPVEVIEDLDMDDFLILIEKAAPLMGKPGAGILKDIKAELAKA